MRPFSDARHRLTPIVWRGGFAALDVGVRADSALWLSTDGHIWVAQPLPFQPTELGTSLVAFRDSLVLGDQHYAGSDMRFEFWTSADGTRWRHAGSLRLNARTPGYSAWGDLVALRDRLAVYSYIGPAGSGGARPAGAAAETAQAEPPASNELGMWAWTSSDARSWTRHRVTGIGTDYVSVYRDTQGYVGVRSFIERPWLVRSSDGIHWFTVARMPKTVILNRGFTFAATRDGYLMAAEARTTKGVNLTIWHVSRSGRFTRVFRQLGRDAAGMAVHGSLVVVTSFPDRSTDSGRALALVSTDDGRSFELSAGWPALEITDCVRDVVIAGHTVVAGGGCHVRGGPALLVADLP